MRASAQCLSAQQGRSAPTTTTSFWACLRKEERASKVSTSSLTHLKVLGSFLSGLSDSRITISLLSQIILLREWMNSLLRSIARTVDDLRLLSCIFQIQLLYRSTLGTAHARVAPRAIRSAMIELGERAQGMHLNLNKASAASANPNIASASSIAQCKLKLVAYYYSLWQKQEQQRLPKQVVFLNELLTFHSACVRCNKMAMITTLNQADIAPAELACAEPVSIYFRIAKKQARLIRLDSPALAKDLKALGSIWFNVPQERLILFYNGFRIDNHSLPITLTQRSIIHVIDRRNFEFPQIILNFKPLWNVPAMKLACSPRNLVRQLVDQFLVPTLHLPQNRFFLVYAGKILNRSNKLSEEFVQDGSEIMVVLFRTQKEIFDKVAYEHHSEKKSQFKHPNNDTSRPVTCLTTLEAFKKYKSQDKTTKPHTQTQEKPKIDKNILLLESFYGNAPKGKETGGEKEKSLSHKATEKSAPE